MLPTSWQAPPTSHSTSNQLISAPLVKRKEQLTTSSGAKSPTWDTQTNKKKVLTGEKNAGSKKSKIKQNANQPQKDEKILYLWNEILMSEKHI